jgi:putative hydrolase of the HAD superfamily
MRKPDPEIFNLVLEHENISPNEALFVDDKTRNTTVAESLGIKSIVFKDAKQLIEELSKYLQ